MSTAPLISNTVNIYLYNWKLQFEITGSKVRNQKNFVICELQIQYHLAVYWFRYCLLSFTELTVPVNTHRTPCIVLKGLLNLYILIISDISNIIYINILNIYIEKSYYDSPVGPTV